MAAVVEAILEGAGDEEGTVAVAAERAVEGVGAIMEGAALVPELRPTNDAKKRI